MYVVSDSESESFQKIFLAKIERGQGSENDQIFGVQMQKLKELYFGWPCRGLKPSRAFARIGNDRHGLYRRTSNIL